VAKTVVLGGGIIGVTTAYFLAKAGEDVTVLERRSGVGLETSFANAGLVAPGHSYTWASPRAPLILLKSLFNDGQALRLKLIPDRRLYAWGWEFLKNCTAERSRLNTARKLRLALYSQDQLKSVTAKEGLTYDQISKGLLYLYRDQVSLDLGVKNMSVLIENGLKLEVLDRATTIALEPALSSSGETLAGAIFCPTDESGDAHIFTMRLYERCLELGVRFEFDTIIKTIGAAGDMIEHVETSRGRIAAERFVLALGCYSPGLVRHLGYNLPVYPVKGYSATYPITDHAHAPDIGGIDEGNLIGWARFGDRLRFTATAEFAGFDTTHQPSDFTHVIKAARDLFPRGADYSSPIYWAGLRPMTPNGAPIIGRSRHRNLFFNTGHGHLGWTMSCGSARLMSDVIQGQTPEIDIADLAPF
jgi:D-amino-acid dehydrogenase